MSVLWLLSVGERVVCLTVLWLLSVGDRVL